MRCLNRKIFFKSFYFKKLTTLDVSIDYLNWFDNKKNIKFIQKKKCKSLLDLKNFVKNCSQDPHTYLIGIFSLSNKHIANIKFDQIDLIKKTA